MKLRYNPNNLFAYGFSDKYTNLDSHPHTLNSFQVFFRESDDMNQDGKATFSENFQWVPPYPNAQIPGGAKNVEIIEAIPPYQLLKNPSVRKKDNIYIEYLINGRGNQNFSHKECISYEVTWCGDGIVDKEEGEKCDPKAPGKSEATCNPVTCQPQTQPGISIKKFVADIDGNRKDGQNSTDSLRVDFGKTFKYIYEIKTSGDAPQSKVTVTDKFPKGVIVNDLNAGSEFECRKGHDNTDNHETVICQSKTSIPANTTKTIEVFVKLATESELEKLNLPADVFSKGLRNIAYVCSDEVKTTGPNGNRVCDPTCIDPNNTQCVPPPPPTVCEPWDKTSPNYDPACIIPTSKKPTLNIKKLVSDLDNVKQKDGQDVSDSLQVDFGKQFKYIYDITTDGTQPQTNITVTDKFPKGVRIVEFRSNIFDCKKGQHDGYETAICQQRGNIKAKDNVKVEVIVELIREDELQKFNLSADFFAHGLRNIAYVCSDEVKTTGPNGEKVCDTKCVDPNNAVCVPPPPPVKCEKWDKTSPHYDPACIILQKPSLKIVKKAKGEDANTNTNQVSVKIGEEYKYTFEVTNESSIAAKGAKVEDVFPDTIEIVSKGVGAGWNCEQKGQTMTCLYEKEIPANTKAPIIEAQARIKPTATSGQSIRNVAAVCELDPTKPANDPNCIPNRDECKPGDVSYNPTTKTCDPSTVVVDDELDLSIKKYIDNDDAQPGSPVTKSNGDAFNYVIRVTVEQGSTAGGKTTVKDVLPENVETTNSPYSRDWNCSINGKTLTCESNQTVTAGNSFADIFVPVRVINTNKGQEVRNDAVVHHPKEKPKDPKGKPKGRCYANNRLPDGTEKLCEEDPSNSDPAVFKTTPPPPTTTPPPPPTYTPPGPGGPVHNPYCGDGIINQSTEKCDPGTGPTSDTNIAYAEKRNNDKSIILCSNTCKLPIVFTWTNPWSKPLNFTITIPTFSKLSLGSSVKNTWFNENGMLVGKGTKIFTLADKVQLSMNAEYKAALTLDEKVAFSIHGNNAINGKSDWEKYIGYYSGLPSFKYTIDSKEYRFVVIGKKGDKFTVPVSRNISLDTSGLDGYVELNPSEIKNLNWEVYLKEYTLKYDIDTINLFDGTELQNIQADVEKGEGRVKLRQKDFELVSFPVKVISGKVSSLNSGVDRKIATFTIDFKKKVDNFWRETIDDNTQTTHASNTVKTNSNFPFGSAVNGGTVSTSTNIQDIIKIKNNCPSGTITNLDDLKHNTNPNVYSCQGNITLGNIKMSGVKTLIVTGKLTFGGNTTYNHADDSWAFIAQEIQVEKDVTNLAGVFLATGKFTGESTPNILRVEGTMYGNAQKLFTSRTYARANNAYDVVTTGTVITYSNRALRNPPPLLSNYLNNFKVQRVIR